MFVIVRHFNVLKTIISSHFLLYEEKNKDKRILKSKKDLSKCSMKMRRKERKRERETKDTKGVVLLFSSQKFYSVLF